jgi:hypothetical protein
MSDTQFYKEVNFLFEQVLTPKKDRLQIRIKDISKNKILSGTDMNYSKVFFDCNLNIFKIDKDNKIVRVDNENFEVVVMKQE